MEQFTEYFFKQGLLGVLFIGSLILNGYLFRQLITEKDKNAAALERMSTNYTTIAKDLMYGNANLQKSIDTLVGIITNKK